MPLALSLDDDARAIVQSLADLEAGWVTSMQASWEIGGDDLDMRRQVRRVLSLLGRARILEQRWVRHRDTQLEIVHLIRERLLDALDDER